MGKNATLRTIIWQKVYVTSAAATALTTVTTLLPLALGEAATMAAVFDICCCHKIHFKTNLTCTDAAQALNNAIGPLNWAVGYDPSNSAVFGSVIAACNSAHHTGPNTGNTAADAVTPAAFSKDGFTHFTAPVPTLVDPGILADLLDGNWVASTDAGVIVGYMKPYVESAGAARLSNLTAFIGYDIEWRFRT